MRSRKNIEEEEESYYMSMTDLMVGVLLIFILIMVYYALQIRLEDEVPRSEYDAVLEERDKLLKENEELRKYKSLFARINKEINESKKEILENLKSALVNNGFDEVIIDNQYGVLSMPADLLFDSGKSEFNKTPRIELALSTLANQLYETSIKYTKNEYIKDGKSLCVERLVCVDNIYIEGHADSDPVKNVTEFGITNNLRLSARRSTNTYQELLKYNDKLSKLYNLDNLAVLSASAHGDTRPKIKNEISEQDKQKNRRIDIRIIMYSPSIKEIENLEGFDKTIQDISL